MSIAAPVIARTVRVAEPAARNPALTAQFAAARNHPVWPPHERVSPELMDAYKAEARRLRAQAIMRAGAAVRVALTRLWRSSPTR